MMTSFGRASGFCVDPIEKKPLNHFYPGSSVLSFGTSGCNLRCRFCQNWDLSHATRMDRLCENASPEEIADAALRSNCKSVAFTYNEPIIFAEFAIATAEACRARGIKTVAVTAGYISSDARPDFFGVMDAANVDLKAFSERFYRELCSAHLDPVLETLEWIRRCSSTWLEVTTLLIPGENDGAEELKRMASWCASHLGVDTPIHFTAYRPAFRHVSSRATPSSTLLLAREIAMAEGMRYVYTGNVRDVAGQSTYCFGCGSVLIERVGYEVSVRGIDSQGRCRGCGLMLAGCFDGDPGRADGAVDRRRMRFW